MFDSYISKMSMLPGHVNNTSAVEKIILDNRRITIREVADDFGILFGSCETIFKDISNHFPKLLNFEQKPRRMHIAFDHRQR